MRGSLNIQRCFRSPHSVFGILYSVFSFLLVLSFPPHASAEYILGPGDELKIFVLESKDLTLDVLVRPDGFISYPILGELKAEGLTPLELSKHVQEGLKTYMNAPEVSVIVTKFKKEEVHILGEIKMPGSYPVTENSTLPRLLASAGGVPPEADLQNVRVYRKGGLIAVNMEEFFEKGALKEGMSLQRDDVVFVPLGTAPVAHIMGEVLKQGSYAQREAQTLMRLLIAAGGTTDHADTKNITLYSKDTVQTFDISSGAFKSDAAIKNGDIVFVPTKRQEIHVAGAVAKPGIYALKENKTVLDALSAAGGFQPKANPRNIKIMRKLEDGKAEILQVNVLEITQKGKLEKNVALLPGDMIYVGRRQKIMWAEMLNLINFWNTLNTLSKSF